MHQVMGAFNGIKRHVNKTCDIHMRDWKRGDGNRQKKG